MTRYGFSTEEDAEQMLNTFSVGSKSDLTRMKLLDSWELLQQRESWKKLSANKKSQYKTAYNRLKELHFLPISEIRYGQIQQVINRTPGVYYPKRDIKVLCGKLFRVAVDEGAISQADDYTDRLELPPLIEENKRGIFLPTEVRSLWEEHHIGNITASTVLFMIYTGLRPGEMRQAELTKIDTAERVMIAGIKTEAGKDREIPLSLSALQVLPVLLNNAKFGLLYCGEGKFYQDYADLRFLLKFREGVTPYWGRHTFATALEKAGVSDLVKKRILGHSTGDITDRYTHIDLEMKINAVDAVASVINNEIQKESEEAV